MLLKLKDIGKIYETNNIYTVGIRNINLEFNLNEFVTIEGESGSGKSTLLNVIGANDTYEEGELYFDNNETSHFQISDWDKYREQNIATIFQDFNIIENLTVLENVEIALLRIKNTKIRKTKAIELINRVGLSNQINQKASKLSGGEKQRTVIARALAKDAPIILADEPTGNLDVKSSQDIASLLKEISKDKLIIVVTHNPEFFEKQRTRQVILKDGSVISDKTFVEVNKTDISLDFSKKNNETKKDKIKNTLWLGFLNYKSRPKFSVLMSFILVIFAISLYYCLAIFSNQFISPLKNTIEKTPTSGKLLVSSLNKNITTDEYNKLIKTLNPSFVFKDEHLTNFVINISKENSNLKKDYNLKIIYDPFKYNLAKDSAVLEISYANRNDINKLVNIFKKANIGINDIKVKKVLSVTEPTLYVSKDSISKYGSVLKALYTEITIDKNVNKVYLFKVNNELEDGKINLINSKTWGAKGKNAILSIYGVKTFLINDDTKVNKDIDDLIVELSANDYELILNSQNSSKDIKPVFYFKSDNLAKKSSLKLDKNYIGTLSNESYYKNNAGNIFFKNSIAYLILIVICFVIGMLISIIFYKNVAIFTTDFAIYKTLGITKKTAKNSLYIQMFLIFIPTLIILPIIAFISVIIPGSTISFISLGNYLFIEIMILLITQIVAFRFNKSIFLNSIRKSLARGLK